MLQDGGRERVGGWVVQDENMLLRGERRHSPAVSGEFGLLTTLAAQRSQRSAGQAGEVGLYNSPPRGKARGERKYFQVCLK